MATVYEEELQHLIVLASQPAWKEYSWKKALELDRCETCIWAGIAEALKAHMLAQRPASSPAPRKRGK
jgi:hypothetical protein